MTHMILAQILSMMSVLVAPDARAAHGGRDAERADLCERLACTDDQRTKIDAIRASHREDMADERTEAKRLREALKAERKKPSPNAEEIARLQASLDAVKAEMRRGREAKKAEISAVLTPEQRERFAAMKAKHEAKRKAHGERGGGKAKASRGPKGKAKAHASRGPKDRAKDGLQAKRERGPKGKANMQAKRERNGKGAALTG